MDTEEMTPTQRATGPRGLIFGKEATRDFHA